MQPASLLALSIFDHEPAPPSGGHVWKGGATDLTTRTMRSPTRRDGCCSRIINQTQAPPPPERAPLLRWDLEQINPGALPSPEAAGGVILVSMNVDPSREEEFNDLHQYGAHTALQSAARRHRRAAISRDPGQPALRGALSRRNDRYLRDSGLDGRERDTLDPAHAAISARPHVFVCFVNASSEPEWKHRAPIRSFNARDHRAGDR